MHSDPQPLGGDVDTELQILCSAHLFLGTGLGDKSARGMIRCISQEAAQSLRSAKEDPWAEQWGVGTPASSTCPVGLLESCLDPTPDSMVGPRGWGLRE